MDTMCCIHSGILFSPNKEISWTYATTWMNFEAPCANSLQISQSQKDTVTHHLYEVARVPSIIETGSRMIINQSWRNGRMIKSLFHGYRVLVSGHEKCSRLVL